MTTRWDIDADSPLLSLAGADRGRARLDLPVPAAPAAPPAIADRLLAGAAEVDITPPPGLPKAGYSRNAHTGRGFRTRLRARVLHLRSGIGSMALVQTDLLGGSAVVHRLVARAIAGTTDVPAAGLYVGATHTHGGPGQFLGTDFYNRFASNRPGFDAAWTQFLASRITAAVHQAVATRSPARLAVGTTDVWGLTRNRSLGSYVRNAGLADRRAQRQRAYLAVDPRLHLLRVDAEAADGGTTPLGALVTFAVHGTGVPVRSEVYNADLWAYVIGELAARVERSHGGRPVVGAVEGPHADVAPALRPGQAGHLEAERVGRGIGARAADLYGELDGRLADRVELACGWRDVDLDRERTAGGVTLPRRPAVGAALVAGAFENETPVIHRIPPFRPGSPRRRARGPQGVKHVLGGPLQRLVLPLAAFPRVVPVQVVRIGPVALVGLPFELTVETGRRIEAAVGAATRGHGVDRVVVTSVANEYAGYCTTAEEYGEQRYEGAHTLYGPGTQSFVAAHAARLAGDTVRDGLVSDLAADRRFDLAHRRYLARPGAPHGRDARVVAGPARFTDATATADAVWRLDWWDVAPGRLAWHEPLVRVEMQDGPDGPWLPAVAHGRPVDDGGCDIEVVHLGPPRRHRQEDGGDHGGGERQRYAVRWWSPGFRAGRRHRFVLVANAGRPEVASDPFD